MIECIRYKGFESGALLGFADIRVHKWGVDIQGVKLYQKDGKRWIQLPSNEYEKDGEKKYSPFMKFIDAPHWEQFTTKVKEAIEAFCATAAESGEETFEEVPF